MMKTPKLVSASLIAIALGAVTFIGCKKDDTTMVPASASVSDERTEANDNFIAASSFNDAANLIFNDVAKSSSTNSAIILPTNFPENIIEPLHASCAKVTYNMKAEPFTAQVDFGKDGCRDAEGNQRSGKILITWNRSLYEVGSFSTITFSDYYFNYNKIEGEIKVENTGYNFEGNLSFNIKSKGSVTVYNEPISPAIASSNMRLQSRTMTYSAFHTVMWMKDASNRNHDVYLIYGRAEGTTLNGSGYAAYIDAPLKKEGGFPFYISGILRLVMKEGDVRTVNYGYYNNERDDLASVIMGTDVEVIIHLNRNPFMIANIH